MSLNLKKMAIVVHKKLSLYKFLHTLSLMVLFIFLEGCASLADKGAKHNNFSIAQDRIKKSYYDGKTDDLATAGLGLDGLRAGAPVIKNLLNPSVNELRRSAIYNSYKKLLPLGKDIGYGRMHANHWTVNNGMVSGYEITAPLVFPDQRVAALVMLQVPDTFDKTKPCIVATASSGSRGIFGAVGVVGGWGLHKNCAVVYTDKGTGVGFHWLTEDKAHNLVGEVTDANDNALFSIELNDKNVLFKEKYPYRLASKHAHSGRNIDQYWGQFVLASITFAFEQLNKQFASTTDYNAGNTLVLGAGISNGGASILRAAETDNKDLFDGIVVSEPAINLPFDFSYTIKTGEKNIRWNTKTLAQRAVIDGLYIPCAALFHDNSGLASYVMPVWQSRLESRCRNLKRVGGLKAVTLKEQSAEAHSILRDNGLTPGSDGLLLAFTTGFIWDTVLVNYINSYGSYGIGDHLCGLSYAYTGIDGRPSATPAELKQNLFSVSGGILPAAGVAIINDNSKDGARSQMTSLDEQGEFDLGFNNLICLREALQESRVRSGIANTFVNGNLHNIPGIIVHGREDNLIHVNHSSRAYYTFNAKQEKKSQLHYYEIENGQHFDALVSLPAFKTRYIPVHHYFEAGLDVMYDKLTKGTPLPPSQRVRTTLPISLIDHLNDQNMPPLSTDVGSSSILVNRHGELVLPTY